MYTSRNPRRGTIWALAGVLALAVVAPAHAQQQAQQAIDPTWLSFDEAAKTVRFQLIAGLTGSNGALNFNGFSNGGLTLVVPLGWNTEMDFRNHDGMVPHSAEVITESGASAIPGAFTLDLSSGLPSEATDTMHFAAHPAGGYLINCEVPGHSAAGMWIRFQVSASAKTPVLLHTPAEVTLGR